ncbi:hypothetical protein BHM03_00047068 [Ensete ventricosum]|nr:hypothetical protein BHM03_00047068 [Ensete ventricosum]
MVQAIPGVPKIKDKYNPATWMLEVSSVAAEVRLQMDFAEHYESSALYRRNKALVVGELSKPAAGTNDLYFPTQFSQSAWGQFEACLWKQWWTYWRSPDYNLVRFFFTLVTALLLGSIFWRIGEERWVDAGTCRFSAAIILTELGVVVQGKRNQSSDRDRGDVFVEIPYVVAQAVYYSVIVYGMMSFQWTAAKFFWFFFISLFSFLYFTYYGMMTVSLSPNHQVAAIFAATFYSVFNLFSGFFIPRPVSGFCDGWMDGLQRIPGWWVWYYWICPLQWTVYGLIVTQYGDLESYITVAGRSDQKIKNYVKDYYGYNTDFMPVVAMVLVGFAVFFAFMFALCIKKLNFQQR